MENQVAKFDNFNNIQEMMSFADVMIKSRLVPASLKQPEQVVAILTQGKELGFGAATSLNNLHNVEGRVTLSVHAIAALIRRQGIKYKLIEDNYFVRQDGTADKVRVMKDDADGKQVPVHKYVDSRTTIRFYESLGNGQILEQDFSFTWSEAASQGLIEKSNWKKMPKTMMRTRCLAMGARFVAPEAIMGIYETTEVADFSNVDLNITDDGGYAVIVD